ncbi:addiction module protein [Aquimarina sp. 2201CG1-2-11]|uniref:addiction module protein n=1 Tax=Aquimarina discodermiae TaxID=3231043 RepID=UPI003461FFDE
MNLQYISDSNGVPTGVFIPMKDWNKLKEKYNDIEIALNDIPEWHKAELDKRLADHRNNPDQVLDFNEAMDDIDKEL